MSASEDVANLFRKFGGQPDNYLEMTRDNQARESKARWPLLSSLQLEEHAVMPSVKNNGASVSAPLVPTLQVTLPAVAGASPFAMPAAATPGAASAAAGAESEKPGAVFRVERRSRPRDRKLSGTIFKKPNGVATKSAGTSVNGAMARPTSRNVPLAVRQRDGAARSVAAPADVAAVSAAVAAASSAQAGGLQHIDDIGRRRGMQGALPAMPWGVAHGVAGRRSSQARQNGGADMLSDVGGFRAERASEASARAAAGATHAPLRAAFAGSREGSASTAASPLARFRHGAGAGGAIGSSGGRSSPRGSAEKSLMAAFGVRSVPVEMAMPTEAQEAEITIDHDHTVRPEASVSPESIADAQPSASPRGLKTLLQRLAVEPAAHNGTNLSSAPSSVADSAEVAPVAANTAAAPKSPLFARLSRL